MHQSAAAAHRRGPVLACLALVFCLSLAGLRAEDEQAIIYHGSSTVYPILVVASERYVRANPRTRIELVCSGSNAGYRALIGRKATIAGMSRPITAKEVADCAKAGIPLIEIPVGFDGITIVASKRNAFLKHMTVAELKRLFSPGGPTTWRQLRAEWPDVPITLFTPGKDSGTFDFFREMILGKGEPIRDDIVRMSEDDNTLVQGVLNNPNAIGYFGLAYYHDNATSLRAIDIDNGRGPVEPTTATILDGTYAPLARTLFVYAPAAALERHDVLGLMELILDSPQLIDDVGYVPLPEGTRATIRRRMLRRDIGSPVAEAAPRTPLSTVYPPSSPVVAERTAAPPTVSAETAAVRPPVAVRPQAATEPAASPAVTAPAPSEPVPATPAAAPIAAPAPVAAATAATAPAPTVAVQAATPAWSGPSAVQYQQELALLRAASLAAARTSLDDGATLDEIAAKAAELKQRADELAERFRTAPRPDARGLTLAAAAALAQ